MLSIKESVKNLPSNPGVYIMYDKNDEVIYVGKAKNLKNRVSSYFRKNASHTPKVKAMVGNVVRFEYIIVASEFEALVLECNLIKQYRPYYNILLKDDKAYPYIKITAAEPFPRIMLARKVLKDKSLYFGPYLNARVVNDTIDLIKSVFNVRSCKKNLPAANGTSRPCLNYQIGRCSAPCAGLISSLEYKSRFDGIIEFLNGNHGKILKQLETAMYDASEKMQFEKAASLRDKINTIKSIEEKQRITSTALGNKDVIAFADMGIYVCFVVLIVRDGKMLNREHYVVKNKEKDSPVRLMTDFVKQHYSMTDYIPNKIILQNDIEDMPLVEKWLSKKCGCKISVSTALRGENKRLLQMAENNAVENLKLYVLNMDVKGRKMSDLTYRIKTALGLENPPMRIESYDISNISGVDSVGVCTVFENCMPKKSEYRLFNIKTVHGADDYESIRETLYRRLENGVEMVAGFELPDLILIDGGKGHVRVAKEIVDFYKLKIPVFGMVKDNRHRTRGVTTENEEIFLKNTDPIFDFITRVQDETHRFAVKSFHRRHKNTQTKSELLNITGVGEAKKNLLLKHFKSVKAVKNADFETLSKLVGTKTAENIRLYFKNTFQS